MPCRRLFFASGLIVITPLVLALGCGPTGDDRDPHPAKSSVASDPAWVAGGSEEQEVQRGHDPEYGQMLYGNTCLACHGTRGQGMPNQGVNLRTSKFIAACSNDQLITFLKKGREPKDPASLVGRLMPPRGGSASLDDTGLGDIVALLRQFQDQARQEGETELPAAASAR